MKKKDIWIFVAIIVIAALAFYFYSQGQGYIKINASGAVATLRLRGGLISSATISSESQPTNVNTRLYKPKQLHLKKQQNDDTWGIYTYGPWGKLAKIKVKNNETIVLQLGPPFLIQPSVQQRGSEVFINFSIIGRAGEHYSTGRITKNGIRITAPTARIVDEAGKVLAVGKFEYG